MPVNQEYSKEELDSLNFNKKKLNILNLQEVCDIIDEVISEYISDRRRIAYGVLLDEKGLYATKRHWWSHKYPEQVKARLDYLRELQHGHYENAITSGISDELNPTLLVWYGKTKLGMMEEYQRQSLANQKKEIDLYEQEISIGFEDEDE